MKKWVKFTLGVIGIIILLFVIDLICIFTFKRPILAIKEDNGDSTNFVYRGLLYDTLYCHEYSKPQIKPKGTKISCAVERIDIGKVVEIKDTTKENKNFACASMLEEFYQDEKYIYYWDCIKGSYMIVKYESGFEETISNALKYETITINDLDEFAISYIKEENTITLKDINTKIQEYFGKENVDRSNLGYNYIDEKNEVIVVGLINNSIEKQEEFMNNVFSSCCGSKYIKYVQSKSMIKFVKTDSITTSNNN